MMTSGPRVELSLSISVGNSLAKNQKKPVSGRERCVCVWNPFSAYICQFKYRRKKLTVQIKFTGSGRIECKFNRSLFLKADSKV